MDLCQRFALLRLAKGSEGAAPNCWVRIERTARQGWGRESQLKPAGALYCANDERPSDVSSYSVAALVAGYSTLTVGSCYFL